MSQQPQSVKKQLVYRFICSTCIQCSDVLVKDAKEITLGAGRDYDGSYDSGSPYTFIVCNLCNSENKFNGSIEDNIKERRIFKTVV